MVVKDMVAMAAVIVMTVIGMGVTMALVVVR